MWMRMKMLCEFCLRSVSLILYEDSLDEDAFLLILFDFV